MQNLTYDGRAMASISPLQPEENLPQLWMWVSLWQGYAEELPHSLETINTLVEQGYIQSQANGLELYSQLYETARIVLDEQGQKKYQTWYKPIDGESELSSVILAFSTDPSLQPQFIPILNPFPLPQLGEYACVEDERHNFTVYDILKLPLEARQRWVALGEAIKTLSAPMLWPAFTKWHEIASNELAYQRELQALKTQQQLAIIDETKTEYLMKEIALRAADIHIENLRTALQKESLLREWEEVRRMARNLAHDYYEYHLQATTNEQNSTIEEPSLASNLPKKTRVKRPHRTPTTIEAKNKQAVLIKSDKLNQEIMRGLQNGNHYASLPDQGVAEYKRKFDKDKGQILITIKPLEGEGFNTILSALNTLGEECVDTFTAVQIIALEQNGVQHIRTPLLISPDDILKIRGKKTSNGSYKPLQRADVIKHLKTLSQAHIIATIPGRVIRRGKKGKPEETVIRAEGAVLDLLSFKIGEYSTITGEELWERRSIAIGAWATMLPDFNNQTALMLRQVLAYSAKNERYQKQIGRYLSLMFRINAKHGGKFPHDISMGALLEGAGIVPPREQGDFRDAIEKALARLKSDKVIGNYWRVIEETPEAQKINREIHEHARGWFASYLQQKWNFSPPETILQQYKNLLREAPEREE